MESLSNPIPGLATELAALNDADDQISIVIGKAEDC
jgi:hypothetical protein